MTQQHFEEIEETIGYRFTNRTLLQQAFVRKSYSDENGGQNNEVLEFLGDSVLGFVLTKKMPEWWGKINQDKQFESKFNESQLTEFRKKLVCKEMLSSRIDILGLNEYLIMGKGDIKNHAEEDASVKEDTFEALIGAVALDSNFQQDVLDRMVFQMLDPEFYLKEGLDAGKNPISLLQEWFQRKGHGLPTYDFQLIIGTFAGPWERCSLVIPGIDQTFSELGPSKPKARMAVAEAAIDYLDKNGLLFNPNDIVKNPSEENAINQLNQLFQNGFISEPKYINEESKDENRNIIWRIEVHVKELPNDRKGTFTSKKEGNRSLAYKTLLDVLSLNKTKK